MNYRPIPTKPASLRFTLIAFGVVLVTALGIALLALRT